MHEPRPRQLLFGLLAALLGTGFALAVAEVGASMVALGRVQVIPLEDVELVDGVPVWHADPIREARACEEPAMVLAGSSILFGSGLAAEESLGPALEDRLGGCVRNLSQPGSTFSTQLVLVEQALQNVRTPVLVWEVWRNSLNDFTVVGDAVYNFGALGPEGTVPSPFGVPDAQNRWLFARSALVRHLDVGWASQPIGVSDEHRWRALMEDGGARARRLAARAGARLVWALMPRLDRPFAESVDEYPEVRAAAAAAGDEVVDVAAALAGEEVEALRADTCCHFNARGQQALAEVLAPLAGH